MPENNDVDGGVAFKLERYKYILQQLNLLNENAHKYLALYQALATAIVGGCIALFVSWRGMQLNAEAAKIGIRAFLWLFIILTVFIIFSIIVSVFSWFDYRKEEVWLLDKEVGIGFRKLPRKSNFWRWSETYLTSFLITVAAVTYLFIEYKVIPLIK